MAWLVASYFLQHKIAAQAFQTPPTPPKKKRKHSRIPNASVVRGLRVKKNLPPNRKQDAPTPAERRWTACFVSFLGPRIAPEFPKERPEGTPAISPGQTSKWAPKAATTTKKTQAPHFTEYRKARPSLLRPRPVSGEHPHQRKNGPPPPPQTRRCPRPPRTHTPHPPGRNSPAASAASKKPNVFHGDKGRPLAVSFRPGFGI